MESRRARTVTVVLVAVALTGLAACSPTPPAPTSAPPASSRASATPVEPLFPTASTTARPAAAASLSPAGPIGTSGSIVVLGPDASLSLIGADGRSILLASTDKGTFGFPTWSPDGSQIASVRYGTPDTEIVVFDVAGPAADRPIEPRVIFRSPAIGPFYLSWTPDGRIVSFLANEQGGLSLRLAPADGSAPLDGTGPGSLVGLGNPFYYDWIEQDRLLAHVGTGAGALLGEIGLDGETAAPAVDSPGTFRSAVVSPDRKFVGYVRTDGGASEVVVAARDGSSEQAMPVFGIAAVNFDPTSATIASIGASVPIESPLSIPVGPLRLLDAQAGADRTLLDGAVVSFWWSPDGQTIAALRVQPVEAVAAAASPTSSPAEEQQEVRLLFVDVASGEIGSQAVVDPGKLFVDQLLTYFDQYALSHHLWAPDSSSILLPMVDEDGTTRVAVMFRNGDPPAKIDGTIGFWSP